MLQLMELKLFKLFIENVKVRWDEFQKSRCDNQHLFQNLKTLVSDATRNSRLLFYTQDKRGNKRLHHYTYDGIYIGYYDSNIGKR